MRVHMCRVVAAARAGLSVAFVVLEAKILQFVRVRCPVEFETPVVIAERERVADAEASEVVRLEPPGARVLEGHGAPPARVQRAVLAAPPAVAARRKAEAERAATESAAAAGLGRLQAPWAVASPPVEANAPRRVVTVRAPGETYDVVVQTKDMGLQFSSVTNGCVVDGVDGYASADPAPSLGSRLVAVDGVRVGGLAFAGAASSERDARIMIQAHTMPVVVLPRPIWQLKTNAES